MTTEAAQDKGTMVITGHFVRDFSFENPNTPSSFFAKDEPKVELSLDVNAGKANDQDVYHSSLSINIKATSGDIVLYVAELTYTGFFNIKGIQDQDLERVLVVECPAFLYPYARRVIQDAIRDGGYVPLNLQPIDFYGMYVQKMANASEQNNEDAPQKSNKIN